jgi:hypothetical protein
MLNCKETVSRDFPRMFSFIDQLYRYNDYCVFSYLVSNSSFVFQQASITDICIIN